MTSPQKQVSGSSNQKHCPKCEKTLKILNQYIKATEEDLEEATSDLEEKMSSYLLFELTALKRDISK